MSKSNNNDYNNNRMASSSAQVSLSGIYDIIGSGKKVAIMTNKFCQLGEITSCWSKRSDEKPGELVDCPDHVLVGNRNSAVLNGCHKLALDTSSAMPSEKQCVFVSKGMLKQLKSPY
jgi:hypothetical protein